MNLISLIFHCKSPIDAALGDHEYEADVGEDQEVRPFTHIEDILRVQRKRILSKSAMRR